MLEREQGVAEDERCFSSLASSGKTSCALDLGGRTLLPWSDGGDCL